MSQPLQVDILSDDDDDDDCNTTTPILNPIKRPRPSSGPIVIEDDPTPPQKPRTSLSSTPSFVPETPFSDLSMPISDPKLSEIAGLICLESDNESEGGLRTANRWDTGATVDVEKGQQQSPCFLESACYFRNVEPATTLEDFHFHLAFSEDTHKMPTFDDQDREKENVGLGEEVSVSKEKGRENVNVQKNNPNDPAPKKKSNEEKMRLMEEKKLKKEQEKLQKAAAKAEAAKLRELEKEKQRWEKGKDAEKSIVAQIDTKVVELGPVGGHLITMFAEKGLQYRITKNPIEKSVVWTMSVPEKFSQLLPGKTQIPYVVLVYDAEDFCKLVSSESLAEHVCTVQNLYPSHTVCYLTNRLMSYINKREQEQYRNPNKAHGWKRPPVEEVFARLTTHFDNVHSRLCVDEAELAEHVIRLTRSLAVCPTRKKLTRCSVNANGSNIPKDCVDTDLIKRTPWLKALIAIPKVQPRFAMAIRKKYPTMRSLLSVYMDPTKTVYEKEFLLKDLTTEGVFGNGDRRLGAICSKRVYRILMSQTGTIKTDDVEDGADFFTSP